MIAVILVDTGSMLIKLDGEIDLKDGGGGCGVGDRCDSGGGGSGCDKFRGMVGWDGMGGGCCRFWYNNCRRSGTNPACVASLPTKMYASAQFDRGLKKKKKLNKQLKW